MSMDDLQAQLRGTLDHQFAALKQKYEEGIAEARRQADADAAAGREQARAEADARVRSVVEQARAAAERAVTDKVGQARAEAEAQVRKVTEEIRAAAERDVAAKVESARAEFEQARAEWETQMQAAAASARAEGEQAAAEAARQERDTLEQNLKHAAAEAAQQQRRALEQKLEQAVADASQREREALEQKMGEAVDQAVAAARRGAELELESERRRAQKEIEAEREKGRTELEEVRKKAAADVQAEVASIKNIAQAEIAAAKQLAEAGSKAAAAPAVTSAAFEQLLTGVQEIDGATTLGQALGSLLKHSALTAGRAAIFLVNGDRLKPWKSSIIPEVDVQTVESSIGGKDLLARAIQAGQAMASGPALPAPPFARLPPGRPGLAVPLMINGRAVAVLYADSGTNPPPLGVAEIVEGLVRHTSAIVALRTAMRNLELVGGAPNGESPATGGGEDDDQGARRFARLLLSEIKLYNEAAVRAGREQRDIRRRLRAEIDRAQRLYEERVPLEVGQRHAYFQQELVQTLADGDPALLGEQ
jgi:chemotaxis protein histidine kinase CheA